MRRIYIAGPYSSDNTLRTLRNIREGVKAAEQVLAAGDAPFCPWLDWMFEMFGDHEVKTYYGYSMAWLEAADVVALLPGWESSKGTLAEIERAREFGIPVMTVGEWLREGTEGKTI